MTTDEKRKRTTMANLRRDLENARAYSRQVEAQLEVERAVSNALLADVKERTAGILARLDSLLEGGPPPKGDE